LIFFDLIDVKECSMNTAYVLYTLFYKKK